VKADLSHDASNMAKQVFNKLDVDGSKSIDQKETIKFWRHNFAKINTAMFFESVDANADGVISFKEWMEFWKVVKGAGHSDAEIIEELTNMNHGLSWRGFEDVHVTY